MRGIKLEKDESLEAQLVKGMLFKNEEIEKAGTCPWNERESDNQTSLK